MLRDIPDIIDIGKQSNLLEGRHYGWTGSQIRRREGEN